MTAQGLYIAMQVYDSRIESAPASGWWWTRDHVEFFISTRPVASDQDDYNVHCHQFFFVPNAAANNQPVPVESSASGTVKATP